MLETAIPTLLLPPAVRAAFPSHGSRAWPGSGYEYREYPPHPELEDSVETYWSLRGDGQERLEIRQGVCKGALDLIFTLQGSFCRNAEEYLFGDRRPGFYFVGPLRNPAPIHSTGDLQCVGVRLRPGRAFPFLRYSLAELVDRVVAVEDPWPDARGATPYIAEGETPVDQLSRIERFLLAQLRRSTAQRHALDDSVVASAIRLMELQQGRLAVDTLTQELGVGRRRLERKFQERVGVPPKLLCRILRIQHALALLAEPRPASFSRVAQAAGYHDQPHFIRDFRAICGMTPGAHHGSQQPQVGVGAPR